jgi:hypothetical protein
MCFPQMLDRLLLFGFRPSIYRRITYRSPSFYWQLSSFPLIIKLTFASPERSVIILSYSFF